MFHGPVQTVAIAVAVAVAGRLVVRRLVDLPLLERHHDIAGFIYAVLGVIYAVLLAFVVVAVWERYADTRATVEREANEIADLYRDAGAFSPPVRGRIRARLRTYVDAVIRYEWPALADGRDSPLAWAAYRDLWWEYYSVDPADVRQQIWLAQSLDRLNDFGDQRRQRLLAARATIPDLLWSALLVLGGVVVGYSYLFGARNVWIQILLTAALAGTLSLILSLIPALEHPFASPARIQPDAFEESVKIFDDWEEP